jgi:NAD+ synthetase
VDVIVNPAASPLTMPKREGRAALLGDVARARQLPVLFVNQVGGFDDVLFDGQSCAFDRTGKLVARAPAFVESLLVVDLEQGGPIAAVPESEAAFALDALAMGTRDYLHKTGFHSALLGLSGGIDSALTAAIAVRALGKENVLGVALPTRYSSEHSLADARELAEQLGIAYREIPIENLFQSYLSELPAHLDALGAAKPGDVTFENIQARIRGNVLMALSNRLGSLLLTTGNKSEVAVGYCTLYGDMAGALAVIADAPKTFVYEMAREVNRQAGRSVIPESTLTKAPSAELRPNQTDQDSLPPYDVLDAILEHYVEDHESADEIIARGFDADTVRKIVRLVQLNEYKRKQMAPGLILTAKAFASGRRYPIAQRYRG